MERLGRIISLDPDDVARAMTEIKRSAPFLPVTVADEVAWEDLSRVSVNAPALPGVTPEVGLSRAYPQGSDFAHVLGYVGPISDWDLEKIENPDQLLRIPRFQIGKVRCRSQDRGNPARQGRRAPGRGERGRTDHARTGPTGRHPGRRCNSPQTPHCKAMSGTPDGESASAVIMDLEHRRPCRHRLGPTFDPNLFVRGISIT